MSDQGKWVSHKKPLQKAKDEMGDCSVNKLILKSCSKVQEQPKSCDTCIVFIIAI